ASLRKRMRRRLGPSFALIGLGWTMLPLSLGLAGALASGILSDRFAAVFGLTLVGGWLLSSVLGVLMRILPFLATLHAAASGATLTDASHPLAESHHQPFNLVVRVTKRLGTKRFDLTTRYRPARIVGQEFDWLLWIQVAAHAAALLLVGVGAASAIPGLARAGAVLGATGAGAFLLYAGHLALHVYTLPRSERPTGSLVEHKA
ncbi:MAG: hypothetical protein L0210_00695, partial [Rhodospirillales bacterium]|nr:hypothetical protein [Rhodospirillales bacterium]